jgi:hypothetical protein
MLSEPLSGMLSEPLKVETTWEKTAMREERNSSSASLTSFDSKKA